MLEVHRLRSYQFDFHVSTEKLVWLLLRGVPLLIKIQGLTIKFSSMSCCFLMKTYLQGVKQSSRDLSDLEAVAVFLNLLSQLDVSHLDIVCVCVCVCVSILINNS